MLVIFVAMFTCAMTAPLVPMPEEAKSNASTTKLQLVEGKSKIVHPCDQDNGGCDQTCLKKGGEALCECGTGFKLGEDWKSCLKEGTTCSAGEIPTVDLCPPAADLTEEEKKIMEQCENELSDSVAQKAIHDARVKAVEEFQESVDGDFCGDAEIKEWIESIEDKRAPYEEKITEGCEIEDKMNTTVRDVITTLDCEGTTSDCIPTEDVTEIVEETETLIEDNQKLAEECQTTVTNLKTEKPIHTEEIIALKEFENHVGDDWCGKTILEEFIEEKEDKWKPSQDKIDENCETIIKEAETLQEVKKIISNQLIDEQPACISFADTAEQCEIIVGRNEGLTYVSAGDYGDYGCYTYDESYKGGSAVGKVWFGIGGLGTGGTSKQNGNALSAPRIRVQDPLCQE